MDVIIATMPALGHLNPLRPIARALVNPIPGQVAELRALLAAHPAQLIVSDAGLMGAGPLYELGGPAWVWAPHRWRCPAGTPRRSERCVHPAGASSAGWATRCGISSRTGWCCAGSAPR